MEGWEEVDCFDKIPGFEATFFYHLLSEIEWVLLLLNLCRFSCSGNLVHWSTGFIFLLGISRNNPRPYCGSKISKKCLCCTSLLPTLRLLHLGGRSATCVHRKECGNVSSSNEFLGVLWKEIKIFFFYYKQQYSWKFQKSEELILYPLPDHDNLSHLCSRNLFYFGGTSSLRLVMLKSFAFCPFLRMGHICLHDLERKRGLETQNRVRI